MQHVRNIPFLCRLSLCPMTVEAAPHMAVRYGLQLNHLPGYEVHLGNLRAGTRQSQFLRIWPAARLQIEQNRTISLEEIAAEALQAGEHGVDLVLPGDDGGQRLLVGASELAAAFSASCPAQLCRWSSA
jgi:hypothetical protein